MIIFQSLLVEKRLIVRRYISAPTICWYAYRYSEAQLMILLTGRSAVHSIDAAYVADLVLYYLVNLFRSPHEITIKGRN